MLRDVAQNHLMQLLAAVVMEMPKSFTKEDVRDARAKAIQAIQCVDPNEVSKYVVRGQYQGYTEEKDVAADSPTETYIATKFFVETPRFSGVPFYMRAGKAMKENSVTISLVFKQTDRKSTRLNSSHQIISYAVFSLKKKKYIEQPRA